MYTHTNIYTRIYTSGVVCSSVLRAVIRCITETRDGSRVRRFTLRNSCQFLSLYRAISTLRVLDVLPDILTTTAPFCISLHPRSTVRYLCYALRENMRFDFFKSHAFSRGAFPPGERERDGRAHFSSRSPSKIVILSLVLLNFSV